MSPSRSQLKSRIPPRVRHPFHLIALILALSILFGNLFTVIAQSFSVSAGLGLQSIAAAIIPFLPIFFLGFLTRLKFPVNNSEAVVFNNFVLFTLWTVLLLGITEFLNGALLPLREFAYSLTLAAILWSYRRDKSLNALAACSYGVILGWLVYLVFFAGLGGP